MKKWWDIRKYKQGSILSETPVVWIIIIVVAVVVIMGILIMKGKLTGLLGWFKNLMRFGG